MLLIDKNPPPQMRIGQRLFTFIAEDKYIIECTLQKGP